MDDKVHRSIYESMEPVCIDELTSLARKEAGLSTKAPETPEACAVCLTSNRAIMRSPGNCEACRTNLAYSGVSWLSSLSLSSLIKSSKLFFLLLIFNSFFTLIVKSCCLSEQAFYRPTDACLQSFKADRVPVCCSDCLHSSFFFIRPEHMEKASVKAYSEPLVSCMTCARKCHKVRLQCLRFSSPRSLLVPSPPYRALN